MADVREPGEIIARINQIEEHLRIVDEHIRREMTKPYFKRRRSFCNFLNLEKKWNREILKELKWVVYA